MEKTRSYIGAILQGHRVAKGWGVNELARRAGVSGAQVSRIEEGLSANPSIELLERLADALGIDVTAFFRPSVLSHPDLKSSWEAFLASGFATELQLTDTEKAEIPRIPWLRHGATPTLPQWYDFVRLYRALGPGPTKTR